MTPALLDTSACIYYLVRPPTDPRRAYVGSVIADMTSSGARPLLSPVTVTELLSRPLAIGDHEAEYAVRLFVRELCLVLPMIESTAELAATLRVEAGLHTADACIAAAAWEHDVAIIGNDRRWRRVSSARYIHIDDEIA